MDEIFNVPEAGTVLGGVLTRGIIREGDPVIVGPREDGTFTETAIATIRRNRTPCRIVRAGEAVTVTLANVERADIRKVLVCVCVCLYESVCLCVCVITHTHTVCTCLAWLTVKPLYKGSP